jgi:hypothetical protein
VTEPNTRERTLENMLRALLDANTRLTIHEQKRALAWCMDYLRQQPHLIPEAPGAVNLQDAATYAFRQWERSPQVGDL